MPTTNSPVYGAAAGLRGHRREGACQLLESACAERSNAVLEIKVDPLYDPIRSDPRFQRLLRQVDLDR